MEKNGFTSNVHHRKPNAKPMPAHIRRGNSTRSKHRVPVEHAFAYQKGPMALVIRTIGIVRAKAKIGMANLTYNMPRMVQVRRAGLT